MLAGTLGSAWVLRGQPIALVHMTRAEPISPVRVSRSQTVGYGQDWVVSAGRVDCFINQNVPLFILAI